MPPQKRAAAKAADTVKVEPASAAEPRPRATTPSKKAVAEAVEKSAEYLEKQAAPPSDVHPRPTTPAKAEVDQAVEQSAEYLRSQGVNVDTATAASPVSAGGTDASLAAAPVPAGRDKSMDASPVFSAPVPNKPADE